MNIEEIIDGSSTDYKAITPPVIINKIDLLPCESTDDNMCAMADIAHTDENIDFQLNCEIDIEKIIVDSNDRDKLLADKCHQQVSILIYTCNCFHSLDAHILWILGYT